MANMLSWFGGQERGDHVRLWREKLGLQKPPPRELGISGTTHAVAAVLSLFVGRKGMFVVDFATA
jgi:hypothetical protein